MNFLKSLTQIWQNWINVGITNSENPDIIERIKSTNRIAIINTVLTIQGGLFVHYLLSSYILSIPVILLGISNLLALLLNYFGMDVTARLLPWLIATIGIFYCSNVFGYDSGVHVLYIVVIIGAIMAHSDAALHVHLILVIISIVFSTLLFATDFQIYDFPIPLIPLETKKEIATNVYGIAIISTLVATFFYIHRTRIYNEKIISSRNELSQRYDELEKVNQEMDNFVYSVSHDLRAPIVSALGLISIALEETELEKMKFYLELEEKSLLKLDKFISEILVYSRNSRTEVENEKVNIQQIIADIIEFQKLDLPSSPVEIKLVFDDEKAFYSDRKRLYAILNNLVSNAVRYRNTQTLKPYVHIHTKINDDTIEIEIKDNGLGIAEKHLPKIFDMFYRAHTRSEGSGLGLYIVREVVNKLGGEISLSSQLGEGTSFYLSLPNLTPKEISKGVES